MKESNFVKTTDIGEGETGVVETDPTTPAEVSAEYLPLLYPPLTEEEHNRFPNGRFR